jgi:cytochrome oxidase Cu insertion factor (SCO1/SenC/PrrC family)
MADSIPATPEVRRGRRQLLLLAALFFVPLALAFWLYYGTDGWRPSGGTNKGDLITPARPLPSVQLLKMNGEPAAVDVLRGKWTMLFVGDGRCDERCRRALYLTRQSRIALNKDMDRVQRVFLVTGNCCNQPFLAQEHPDLLLLQGGPGAAQALLTTLPSYGGIAPSVAGRTYLIDPLGNLMMSYAPQAPDKALLTDIKKLLRLSHIG